MTTDDQSVAITPIGVQVYRVSQEPTLDNIAELQRLIEDRMQQELGDLRAFVVNIKTARVEGSGPLLRWAGHADALIEKWGLAS